MTNATMIRPNDGKGIYLGDMTDGDIAAELARTAAEIALAKTGVETRPEMDGLTEIFPIADHIERLETFADWLRSALASR